MAPLIPGQGCQQEVKLEKGGIKGADHQKGQGCLISITYKTSLLLYMKIYKSAIPL